MPRSPRVPLLLALTGAAALLPLGCGGEDAKLLPGETAREITANLDTVQQLSSEGDCLGAESAAQQVDEQIEALQGVDPKLKRALEDGAQRLEEVISECDEEAETLAPATTEEETTPAESEKEAKEREKEEEKAEKDAEKEEERQRKEEETAEEGNPALPPQAKGEGKGLEEGKGPPVEESGETPSEDSGGVSPGSAVEGE
jgi:chromatin assembly factor 1 subunit A